MQGNLGTNLADHVSQAWKTSSSSTRPTEVIYQIYPATFRDSNGDGHGDLQGVLEGLDYVASLGADAVWINPIYESPDGPEGDGGYAVTNQRVIASRYGTMEDMKAVLAKAKKLNLRVYMDFIPGHTSSQHEWFQKSRAKESGYEDFYAWHPGRYLINGQLVRADAPEATEKRNAGERPEVPNNWRSVFGGSFWNWDEQRKEYIGAHFLNGVNGQPALNLNKKEVQDAVLADMKFWLDAGVDGLRIDSLPYAIFDPEFRDNPWMDGKWPRPDGIERWEDQYFQYSMCQPQIVEFIMRMRALADNYKENKTLIGEVIAGPWGGKGSRDVAEGYVNKWTGLDCCYTTYERAIGMADPGYVRDLVRGFAERFPDGGLMFTVSDHDGFDESPRAYTRMTRAVPDEHKEAAYRQALQIYATIPGSFSMLMGDELGLCQAQIPHDIPLYKIKDPIIHTKGRWAVRDGSRTPFPADSTKPNAGFTTSSEPYLPVPESHISKCVDVQHDDPNSTLNYVRDMIAWRKSQTALVQGKTRVLETYGDVLAFLRKDENQTVLCVFNLTGNQVSFTPSDLLDENTLLEIGLEKGDRLELGPYSSAFPGEWIGEHNYSPSLRSRVTKPQKVSAPIHEKVAA